MHLDRRATRRCENGGYNEVWFERKPLRNTLSFKRNEHEVFFLTIDIRWVPVVCVRSQTCVELSRPQKNHDCELIGCVLAESWHGWQTPSVMCWCLHSRFSDLVVCVRDGGGLDTRKKIKKRIFPAARRNRNTMESVVRLCVRDFHELSAQLDTWQQPFSLLVFQTE